MYSYPPRLFKPTKDPWCKACGGRHDFEQCSLNAPTQPPQEDGPDRNRFRGPNEKLPPAPGNAKVFRARFKFPLASFNWRRMIHGLLWKYSNTEQDSLLLEPLLTIVQSFSVPATRVDRIELDSSYSSDSMQLDQCMV
jgi:hypothetical protein